MQEEEKEKLVWKRCLLTSCLLFYSIVELEMDVRNSSATLRFRCTSRQRLPLSLPVVIWKFRARGAKEGCLFSTGTDYRAPASLQLMKWENTGETQRAIERLD